MEIRTIRSEELKDVIALFCECFFDDYYYERMFPDPNKRKAEMGEKFSQSLLYCINGGGCLGIYDESKMIAFVLSFDYKSAKINDRDEFDKIFGLDGKVSRATENMHKTIDALDGRTVFCLSLAVDKSYRGCSLASGLIDVLLEKNSGSNVVSDVSNTDSLAIYTKRNYSIETIEEGYHLVIHRANDAVNTFDCSNKVRVIIPDGFSPEEHGIIYSTVKEKSALCAYEITDGGIPHFRKNDGAVSFGRIIEVDYHEYLKYQRVVNTSVTEEKMRADFSFFELQGEYEVYPLFNDVLSEMVECRQAEWSVIPDVFVSVPVQYDTVEKIVSSMGVPDEKTEHLIRSLDFRTHYELGIQSRNGRVDELANCKNRIKRYYLGKVKVQISTEITLEHYDGIGDPIGNAGYIDLYISLDSESDCAVLSWYSLSTPFLISHYLDNIICNQLIVIADEGRLNIYDYLNMRYGIVKKGTPKMFVIIPEDKSILRSSQIASLIAGETIYPDGENLGGIIDPEIVGIVESEYGMGQYDRAYVYAYTNVVLQFSPDLRGTLTDRISEESITQFYIELILFQEAAIHIADRAIASLFTTDRIDHPVEFLAKVDAIHDNYSKTIDFWDINVNYPTSQKSINMLRQAFKLREQLDYMTRNQEHLNMVFDTKCDIVDRKDANRMDKSLAIISVLAIFSAWADSFAFVESWQDILSPSLITVIQRVLFFLILIIAGYAIIHLFGGKLNKLLDKTRKNKKRYTSATDNK